MRELLLKSSVIAMIAAGFSCGGVSGSDTNTDPSFEYQCMLSAYHIRENEKFWGKDNYTNLGFSPTFAIGNWVFEGEFTYGASSANKGVVVDEVMNVAKSQQAYKTSPTFNPDGKENSAFDDKAKKIVARNMWDRQRFFRNYTRFTYEDPGKRYKVILGDSSSHVTFGNMQGLFGAGISIFRSADMFDRKQASVLNSQSAITILRPSLVEVVQDGCTIQANLYAPGVYALSDIAPECNLHNVEITITDDFQHGYTYRVDGNSDKIPLTEGDDEFEVRVLVPGRFDPSDPYTRRYSNTFVFSGVYRYGYSKDLTLQFNTQAYTGGLKAETGYSYSTKFGLFSQAVGISASSNMDSRRAVSAQVYYATPQLPMGTFQVSGGIVGKGYIDLGAGFEKDDIYRRIYNLVKSTTDPDYVSSSYESTTKNLSVRFIPRQIFDNVGFSFFYKQFWEDHRTKYSYDASFTWKIANKYTFVSGIGITCDRDGRTTVVDITKGTEIQRRFYIAVDIPVGRDVCISSSYDYDDDRSFYSSLEYKPKAIAGLTLELNSTLHNGYGEWRNHGGKVKYESTYGDFRFDHSITMRHKPGIHKNRERIFVNTYIKNNEFVKKYKNSPIVQYSRKDLRSDRK